MAHREHAAPTPLVLLGRWHLDRVIDDRLAGERVVVDAEACLDRSGDGRVRWHEEGLLRRPSQPGAASVFRTLWVEPPHDDEPAWWVTFEDGRRFHPWSPGTQVEHPCAPDVYRGLVEVVDPDRTWSVVWQARGPRKDYTITSAYRRLD